METKLILLLIYIISAIGVYFIIRKQHSKNGEFEILKPDFADFLSVFLPIINTMFCIMILIHCSKFDFSKFFKIKN